MVGPDGAIISSTVVPQAQAVFPEGALRKSTKIGLQVGAHRMFRINLHFINPPKYAHPI